MKLVMGLIFLVVSQSAFSFTVIHGTAGVFYSSVVTGAITGTVNSPLYRRKLEANQIKAEFQEFTATGVMPKFLSEKVEALQMVDSSLDKESALEEVVTRASEF